MTNNQSKIEKLIAELCPNGVEFKELRELGEFYGGLSGKSKDDFSNGNAKFVTYMNIYSNIAVNTDIDVFVKVGKDENQNKIEYGDVLFTGSSETPDECGMSSVLTKKINEPLYLNSFCFGFRLNDKNLLLPEFSKYLFRDEQMRKQIAKTASGVTRFNVSKKRFAKMTIPLPPLAIQEKIVKILNSFTELEAELEAREKQYEHYRNELFVFDQGVEFLEIKELALETFWIMPATPKFTPEGDVSYITSKNIRGGHIDFKNVKKISKQSFLDISKNRPIIKDDILISMIGTIGEVARVKDSDLDFYGQNMYLVRLNQEKISVGYFLHFFDSIKMKLYFGSIKNNSSQGYLKAGQVESIKIPVPPLAEQERIVLILDKFDALVNDISIGLPAELSARRQQYEYYRGKLLTFNEYAK